MTGTLQRKRCDSCDGSGEEPGEEKQRAGVPHRGAVKGRGLKAEVGGIRRAELCRGRRIKPMGLDFILSTEELIPDEV